MDLKCRSYVDLVYKWQRGGMTLSAILVLLWTVPDCDAWINTASSFGHHLERCRKCAYRLPGRATTFPHNKRPSLHNSQSNDQMDETTSSPHPSSCTNDHRIRQTLVLSDASIKDQNSFHVSRAFSCAPTKLVSVLSRTLSIAPDFDITVYEWEKPATVVETYWQAVEQQKDLLLDDDSISDQTSKSVIKDVTKKHDNEQKETTVKPKRQMLDPFGLVTWPGSIVAVRELRKHAKEVVRDKRVLLLGAGVGVEAQAAAILGARSVLATDIHPTTLQLLQYGAKQAGLDDRVETQLLDIAASSQTDPLPACDLMVVADVLYDDELAMQVIKRCVEARVSHNATVLVTDSQRFCHSFENELNRQLQEALASTEVEDRNKTDKAAIERYGRAVWKSRFLSSFTGSGVLIDSDQTYNVQARVMWIGYNDTSDK